MTTPSRELDQLQRLQAWYLAHCNGDWEHTYGITISTLDNPGWTLEVELAETELFERPFETVQELIDTPDWIHCSICQGKFVGACGPLKLATVIAIFVDWAGTA
jgi:hypothetical protein